MVRTSRMWTLAGLGVIALSASALAQQPGFGARGGIRPMMTISPPITNPAILQALYPPRTYYYPPTYTPSVWTYNPWTGPTVWPQERANHSAHQAADSSTAGQRTRGSSRCGKRQAKGTTCIAQRSG